MLNTLNIPKEKDHAFRKDIYLLGRDKFGTKHWLEAPSWDCNWYWGFGYIETYTNNNSPSTRNDISSHSHAGNFMEYATSTDRILVETTFTEKEAWKLCELFTRFNLLSEMAGYYHRGGCNMTELHDSKEDLAKCKQINEEEIPYITSEILKILTPNKVN